MNIQSRSEDDTLTAWIGLAHVKPRAGSEMLGNAVGAFVPALALARNQQDFISKIVERLTAYDCEVIEIKDIERCETRFGRQYVAKEVRMLANSLTEDSPVALDTFQTYLKK